MSFPLSDILKKSGGHTVMPTKILFVGADSAVCPLIAPVA